MKILLLVLVFIFPQISFANTIRDDEIEAYLREISTPIFKAANLNPSSIKIYIIQNDSLNAFVAGGQNLFLHSKLITHSKDPSMLMGVIAHETGHIAGGHLIKKSSEAEQAMIQSVVGTVLGIASVAAGAPSSAAAALSQGGKHLAERNFLRHSRSHEQAADQAAIKILAKIGVSANGLLDLLKELQQQQNLFGNKPNPYAITHPLSSQRIDHIEAEIAKKGNIQNKIPDDVLQKHLRIIAKLDGFIMPADKVKSKYSGNLFADKYAKSILYFRTAKLDQALEILDSLIAENKSDPYLLELKGQMLFESGKVQESLIYYKKALDLSPNSTMMKLGYGIALIAAEKYSEAISNISRVLVKEPKNSLAWRQLSIAEGRSGNLGNSYLALAEEALILKNKDDLLRFIELAKKHLPANNSKLKSLEMLIKKK